MSKIQSITNLSRKTGFLLALILATFLLKGIFLAVVFPIFTGQDESRHYNTIQFLNEPKVKSWPIATLSNSDIHSTQNKDDLTTYRFSEEIKKTTTLVDNDVLRTEIFNTIAFSRDFTGNNEAAIEPNNQEAINAIYPPDITGGNGQNLYHLLGSLIEKLFSGQSILVRFYSIRIFSVLLGTLTLLLSFLILKNIGFSEKISLLLTAITSFQPKFSFYTTNINYAPLLFVSFALFTLGAVLYLKNGLRWKNLILMLASIIVGIRTKETAIIIIALFLFLMAYEAYRKTSSRIKNAKYLFILFFAIAASIILALFHKYLPLKNFPQVISTLRNYLSESLTVGHFALSARTYWGTLSWVNSWFMGYITNIIWAIETVAAIGLGIFLFSKRKFAALPEKKYVIFFIVMIFALQLGVRAADWNFFARTGNLDLGTPGRYFLPNLAIHLALVYIGLGSLLAYFKKERAFEPALALGLIAMFSLSMYLIFDVIIYRYYL